MIFQGHTLIKLINNTWVLDLDTLIGYRVTLNKDGAIERYKEAFRVKIESGEVYIEKETKIPVKVLKEAAIQARKVFGEDDETPRIDSEDF